MECPLPRYWLCHIIISLLIACAIWPLLGLDAGLCAGAFFYIGREVRDREKLGAWDWYGLLAPVLSCLGAFIISRMVMLWAI